jgi:hypothetical protein
MANDGKIHVQSDLVPNNLNPRMPVTDTRYVKGSPQVFATIHELIGYHPNLMRQGVPLTVANYPSAGVTTEFRLNTDPAVLVDSSNNSIITADNFRNFFDISSETNTSKTRVYQYAADGPGGGAPIFPYTTPTENVWSVEYNRALGHRWMRWRDDDVDENDDGIFDNWTAPVPVNSAFTPGDYIANLYKRQDVDTTVRNSITGLVAGKYYIVQQGSVDITGDLTLNDIGVFITTSQTLKMGIARVFKYSAANAYLFNDSATVIETVQAPPRVVDGLTNDEPVGWSDQPPLGSQQLWEITAQKSVYGKLKSDWIVRKINEDPDFIRYNNVTAPHPDTLVNTTTVATTGSGGDTALNNEGWTSVYALHHYMATRELLSPGVYSQWVVRKIDEESGEYTDSVFKLFDSNLDLDDVALAPPTQRDPTEEGWSDTPLAETDTKINYVSQARKFFDGSLKTSWSKPVPYTGKSIFNDIIVSDLGGSFKYDQFEAVMPAQITLKADLYKGTSTLWQSNAITYEWKIVYNNGGAVDVDPTTNPADNFYLLGASGTPGDPAYIRANQRVVVKPGAVDGTAVLRCTQTLPMDEGDDLVFIEEFTIVDITDGKDARNLTLAVEKDLVIYDTVNLVFNPLKVRLRAYQSNIPSPIYYWYRKDGGSWTNITTPPTGYTITGNLLEIDLATAALFAGNTTAEEKQFAVSTHATNPDSADYENSFSDFATVAKASSNAVGQDGDDSVLALLNNEAHNLVLDRDTGIPLAGEIGVSGRAKTTLQLYLGLVKQQYGGGGDYTIAVADDNANVTFAFAANGDDVDIYVNTWGASETSAVCTVTITFGALTLTKKFSVSTTRDAPGAILLDIQSNKGFEFSPQDRTNKTLTAKLYDTTLSGTQEITLPDAMYTFRWNVASVWSSPSTSNTFVVSRNDILVSYDVTVEVYKSGVLFKSRSMRVNDIVDGKTYRLYSTSSSEPAAPPSGIDPDVGNGTWVPASTNAIWAVEGNEDPTSPGNYIWSNVHRIRGEAGSQGSEGGFPHYMYKAEDPGPPAFGSGGNTSTLNQMQLVGWQSSRPTSGIIWMTTRYWVGQGVTFNGAGDPSTAPLAGSVWQPPVRLSGKDGTSGGTGGTGNKGWSPAFGVIDRASIDKVLQLIDWVNGEGTKPVGVGQYIGISGLVADINNAANIAGVPVEMRYSGGYIQWKYTTEGAGAWRSLTQVAPIVGSMGVLQNSTSSSGVLTLLSGVETANGNRRHYTTTAPAWTNTLGVAVLIEMNISIQGRRDSGSADAIDLIARTVIGASDQFTTRRFHLNGESEVTLMVSNFRLVNPGETISWYGYGTISSGGNCYMSPAAWFNVKIVS